MSFTGRRKSGIGDSILRGLSAIGTAISDGPKMTRIREIDAAVAELLQERDHMIAGLIEPGDLKVSKNYNPNWTKPVAPEPEEQSAMDAIFGEKQDAGRLTQCKGRSHSGTYHGAHPGCPYVGQIHTSHEFTLRD